MEVDIDAMERVLPQGFAGANELFDGFDFDETDDDEITRGVIEAAQGAGLG